MRFKLAAFAALISISSFAHSGRTDASGCHTNRKTGDYHCHGSTRYTPNPYRAPSFSTGCCKVCTKGKACGNSCISVTKSCNKGPGCACDG